ncbi:hypothetical protein CAEBREN_16758 [Caenorhabditis brenneri]|uniref:F-box domain-containing protein n=1 Tax=Caenorhabditis brenneri TaxID=135651 RepID=G0NJY3_CAEBE|nr:hypothetical protein CAEBREN_16758 [Caenorhabditis brenneri]
MDVVAFIFPLLSLKPEVVQFIIKCMDEIDIVTFSLISRGTKNLVESIGFTATKITIYVQGGLLLSLKFRTKTIDFDLVEWNDEWREGIDDQYDMTVADVVSVEPDDVPEMVDYEMPNFELKDWIGHLMFIFHIRFIDYFDFELSDCRFTFDSISREFNRNSVKHLIIPSTGNQFYRQQLIDYFQAPRITIPSNDFPERHLFHRVLIQNHDFVCIYDGGNFTLNDLMITNSKAIRIYDGQTMMKTINRFIKLWQPGSNLRLECLVIYLNEVWLPQDLFKSITYTEMNDEIEVESDKREEYGLFDSNVRRGGYAIWGLRGIQARFFFHDNRIEMFIRF